MRNKEEILRDLRDNPTYRGVVDRAAVDLRKKIQDVVEPRVLQALCLVESYAESASKNPEIWSELLRAGSTDEDVVSVDVVDVGATE